MQDSVAAVCNDLSSRDYNVAPINCFMNQIDEMLPQIRAQMKKEGVTNPDDLIPAASWEISAMIERNYADLEILLNIEEVKSLWNSVMEAGQGSFEILEEAAFNGIDSMQPDFDEIMKSVFEMDTVWNPTDQTIRNLHRAMTKLFKNHLTSEMILGYVKDVFKQIKPVGAKIDELMASESFLRVLATKNHELAFNREKISIGSFKTFENQLETMVDDWTLLEVMAEEKVKKMSKIARYIDAVYNVFVDGFSSGNFVVFETMMKKFEKMIDSYDFFDLIDADLILQRKLLEEVTEDEVVEIWRQYRVVFSNVVFWGKTW